MPHGAEMSCVTEACSKERLVSKLKTERAKNLNRYFTQEEIHTANKQKINNKHKKGLTSLSSGKLILKPQRKNKLIN